MVYPLLRHQLLTKIPTTAAPVVTALKNNTIVILGGAGVGATQRRLISSLSVLSKKTSLLSSSISAIGTVVDFSNNNNNNNRCRYYHSSQTYNSQQQQQQQLVQDENNSNGNGDNTSLPSNLTFDLKSSFAPLPLPPSIMEDFDDIDGEENDDDETSNNAGGGEEIENKKVEAGDEQDDLDDDDDDLDDDDALVSLPLSSSPGINNRYQQLTLRPVQPLPDRLKIQIIDGPIGSSITSSTTEGGDNTVGSIWLESSIFGIDDIRVDLIKQNVDYIRNKIRGVRKAKTKTISEVSGSGRKVRPQKGGGTARAGHSRPAHWRGGAKAHGPKNTVDYGDTKLNKNVKKLAMRSMLSQKLKEGNLIVVNHLQLESHKTGQWAKVLDEQYGVGKTMKKKDQRKQQNNSNNNTMMMGAPAPPTTTALIVDHYLEPDNKNVNNNDEKSNNYSHASYHGVPINLWVATSNIPRVKVQNQRFLNVYDILKKEKLIITLSALEEIEKKWSE